MYVCAYVIGRHCIVVIKMIKVLQKKLTFKLPYIYAFQFSIICFEISFAIFSNNFKLFIYLLIIQEPTPATAGSAKKEK